MSQNNLDESEKIFHEDFEFLHRIEKVKQKQGIEAFELMMEYNVLAEKYSNLLKNAVRILRISDKAQKKLLDSME